MKKMISYIFVALLCIVMITPIAFGSDSIPPLNHSYVVAIDPAGNMRLLRLCSSVRWAIRPS